MIKTYFVDSFTSEPFKGNPAGVCILDDEMGSEKMLKIANEIGFSETAFIKKINDDHLYSIRYFSPKKEIALCGHATLASAFVLFNKLSYSKDTIRFQCKSGLLRCTKNDGAIEMDFPAWKPEPVKDDYSHIVEALGNIPVEGIYKHRDVLVEVPEEEVVRTCVPDFTLLKKIGEKVIITSWGKDVDFVSRFFAPVAGIDEDPVTGSAHSQLIPFWAERSGKNKLHAKQLSERGGELWCQYLGERVTMAGKCVFYMKGEIEL